MTILVTGATGQVGRQVVAQLLPTGASVRALTRSGSLPGAGTVHGDLSNPDSLAPALDGVDTVFLLWPLFTVETAPAVVELIAKHARRLVYLSAMPVRDDVAPMFHAEMERLIAQSGLEWTFLRSGGFATNTLLWAAQIRASGVVRWPYAGAARSLVHERDIAAVAVRALTEDGHAGARYVLTGPSAVTQAAQVQAIGDAIGRTLRYEELPREVAREQLVAAWGDPSAVDGALDYWASLVSAPEPVTSTVEDLTGVPARTFREWAQDHATDFS